MLEDRQGANVIGYQAKSAADAIAFMECMLPALITHTTAACRTLFSAVAKTNMGASERTPDFRVNAEDAESYHRRIAAVNEIFNRETVKCGGIFIPNEGEPWSGFRSEMPIEHDALKTGYQDFVNWRQLLSSATKTSQMLKSSLQDDDTGAPLEYTISNRHLNALASILTCPDLNRWLPGGLRYHEVRAALLQANGRPLDPSAVHALKSMRIVPEGRMMPVLEEVMSSTIPSAQAKRTLERAEYQSSQPTLAGFEQQVPSPAARAKNLGPATEQLAEKAPQRPAPRQLDMSF